MKISAEREMQFRVPGDVTGTGSEKVTHGGNEFDCTWQSIQMPQGVAKLYRSAAVPFFGVLKVEMGGKTSFALAGTGTDAKPTLSVPGGGGGPAPPKKKEGDF
jgi:hypothetical protein